MTNLSQKERIRRVVLLCSHFARNLAYYRVSHANLTGGRHGEFFATVDANFLDMAVIEWCKLIGDKRGRHFWGKVVSDQSFENSLLRHLGKTAHQLAGYVNEMREYRDKFLAHLDDERIMNIPNLDVAKAAVEFYHQHVVNHEAAAGDLAGLPKDLPRYYQKCFDDAQSIFGQCNP